MSEILVFDLDKSGELTLAGHQDAASTETSTGQKVITNPDAKFLDEASLLEQTALLGFVLLGVATTAASLLKRPAISVRHGDSQEQPR